MWKRPVRAAIRRGLGHPRVRSVVEAELKARQTAAPAARPDAEPAPALAAISDRDRVFVDRHGVDHPLDPALRDRLKPEWRTALDPAVASRPPSDGALRDRARNAAKVVSEASALFAAVTGTALAGRVLEVGCYDGAAAYRLARQPGTRVVASDVARYYVVQRPGASAEIDLAGQQALLDEIRERARSVDGTDSGQVEFVEDDITESRLESASFDAIVSFEVLEHVAKPAAAFAGIARLLRPGGITYHDYNPFFSFNGGHSLCTLDFPWGHARLDAGDFERYVRELRPSEADQALRFYRESLNRLTLRDLRTALAGGGLEPLAVVPWFDRGLGTRLQPGLIAEVQRTYSRATVEDLLATFVTVIARKAT